MSKLFDSVRVGRYTLQNRLVMAPMTRSRAQYDGTPGELAAEYYAQRAGVGLIVAEGAQPSDDGQGYLTTPGIYKDAHVAGWKKTADAVHAQGGHLFRMRLTAETGRQDQFDERVAELPLESSTAAFRQVV